MLPILPALATRRGDTNIGALHDFSGARIESWHPARRLWQGAAVATRQRA